MIERLRRLMVFGAETEGGAAPAAEPAAPAATESAAPQAEASTAPPGDAAASADTPPVGEAAPSEAAATAAEAPAVDAKPDTAKPAEADRANDSFLGDGEGKPAEKDKPAEAKDAKPAEKPADKDAKPEAAKPDGKADEAAPGEKPQAPTYSFNLPEGVSLDKERMGTFTEILGKNNVTQEFGQQLVDMHVGEMQRLESHIREAQFDAFRKTQDEWRDAIKTDPELGGSRIDTTMKVCGSVIEQYGGSPEQQAELRARLKWSGAGNDPNLVRLLHNIGKALGEGEPRPAREPSKPIMSKAERRYGNKSA